MMELLGRGGLPFQLGRGQAILVLALIVALVLAGLALLLLDGVLMRLVELVLRKTGHPPPRKSPFRVALDAMDDEISKPKG